MNDTLPSSRNQETKVQQNSISRFQDYIKLRLIEKYTKDELILKAVKAAKISLMQEMHQNALIDISNNSGIDMKGVYLDTPVSNKSPDFEDTLKSHEN